MFELTINGEVYQFNFGMGFMREADKGIKSSPDQNGVVLNIGANYMIGGIVDGDIGKLEEALLLANKGFTPRVKLEDLDGYIDDPSTDVDKLFEDVKGFLRKAGATRILMKKLEAEDERLKKIREAAMEAQLKG